jgi:hypothetical protein
VEGSEQTGAAPGGPPRSRIKPLRTTRGKTIHKQTLNKRGKAVRYNQTVAVLYTRVARMAKIKLLSGVTIGAASGIMLLVIAAYLDSPPAWLLLLGWLTLGTFVAVRIEDAPTNHTNHGLTSANPQSSKWRVLRVARVALRTLTIPAI